MTVTFDSVSKEKKPKAADAEPDAQVAVQAQKNLVAFGGDSGDVEGEITSRQMQLPFVSIVQKTTDSAIIKAFGLGSTVLGKEVLLAEENGHWEMTPLHAQLAYVQNVPFGTEGNTFYKSDEVLAVGGHFRFDKNNAQDPTRYDEQLFLSVAVRKPEGLDEELEQMFPYDFGDYCYAGGIMRLKGGSYFGLGKTILTHRRALLNEGLRYGRYEMGVAPRQNAKGEWHIFVGKFIAKHDEETAQSMKTIL